MKTLSSLRENGLILWLFVGAIYLFLLLQLCAVYNASSFGPGAHVKCDFRELIEARLNESEENWKRGTAARNLWISQNNTLDPKDPWNFKYLVSIWDFFYPHFDCPHTKERIGLIGAGGKWICGLNHLSKKKEPCIVYSYGVKDDWSLETEIIDRTSCSIYMFDHTVDKEKVELPKKHPDRVFFEKVGLGANNAVNLRTIATTMKKYGHHFIDVLKVDVEGAEFAVFQNIVNDFPNELPFGQLLVELHLPKNEADFLHKHLSWLTHLEDMGLRAYSNELNLVTLPYYKYTGFIEYSFINIKHDNYLLHASS